MPKKRDTIIGFLYKKKNRTCADSRGTTEHESRHDRGRGPTPPPLGLADPTPPPQKLKIFVFGIVFRQGIFFSLVLS